MNRHELSGKILSREDFVFFWGHCDRHGQPSVGKSCLSQWYMAPMVVDGVCYNCMEQYIMAEKARLFGDIDSERKIMAEYSQMEIKKLGRRVAGYDDGRWKAVRKQISVKGNLAKFSQNKALGDYLLSTGDKILVEASPKDMAWGIGLAEDSCDAPVPARWKGENILGFALMEVREILRSAQKRFDDIVALKDESDPWPPDDFIEFCGGKRFTGIIEWTCDGNVFDSVRTTLETAALAPQSRIMIDLRYGPDYGIAPFMFFEALHETLDPLAEDYPLDYIFSLTPDATISGTTCHLTMFY